MLKHIKEQIPLTTDERSQMKNGIYLTWDGTTSLRSFINRMTEGMKAASFWNVHVQQPDMVDHLVSQIYKIDPFESKVMTDWETRRQDRKTWEQCIQYFQAEADKQNIIKKATAKQAGYESAANVEEKSDTASTTDEEHVNIIVEQLERNGEQMNAVAMTNAKLENTVAELTKQMGQLLTMNSNLVQTIVALGGTVADKNNAAKVEEKENASKKRKLDKEKSAEKKLVAKKCNFCGEKHTMYGKFCVARKCNAHLRPEGWSGTEIDK